VPIFQSPNPSVTRISTNASSSASRLRRSPTIGPSHSENLSAQLMLSRHRHHFSQSRIRATSRLAAHRLYQRRRGFRLTGRIGRHAPQGVPHADRDLLEEM